MSKTGDKIFKYALDKGRSVKNTLWIAGCFLLVAANIAFFLLFPRIVSGLAIVLSNAVTLILTFLAFKPLNSWLQDSLMERQQALIEKMEKDRELERKVEVLELENRTLADKLDTRVQTGALPVRLDYTFKVEQMEYAKQGYVVKEEEVDALDREQTAAFISKSSRTPSSRKPPSARSCTSTSSTTRYPWALTSARSCTPWRTGRSSSTASGSRNCTTSPAKWSPSTATSTGWRS